MRFISLSCVFFTSAPQLHAQIPASSYGFTALSGTFTEITGTAVTGATGTFMADDENSNSIPIGFTFNYCGNNVTSLVANSNGWLSFNTGVSTESWTNSTGDLGDIRPALMPLWDDLAGWGNGAAALYAVSGTAPNRVFTFQYKNWNWRSFSGADPNISIQVKLYETTNVIEYIYRQEPAPGDPTSYGATIGIADESTSYLVLSNSTAAPTPSSTTFITTITSKPATGQIYRFTPPDPCNTIATWPTATAATIFPNSVCVSGSVNLGLSAPLPPATGLTYQWQYSPTNAAPWTDIGPVLNAPAYTATGVNGAWYFRCRAFCNGGATPVWTSLSSPQLTVTNPGTPATVPGSRCGPGTVNLSATPTAGGPVLRWYTAPTGGNPVFTGNNFTTNFITATTNYYVSAGTAPTPLTTNIGAGAQVTPWVPTTMFAGDWGGYKHQFLIRAQELIAQGISPGMDISSIAVEVDNGTGTYQGFSVSLKNTTTNALGATFETGGFTEVVSPAPYTTTIGVNTFTFNAPFTWDGSNLLIQTCWSNNNGFNNYSNVTYDPTPYASTLYGTSSNATPADLCDAPDDIWGTMNERPKFIINYDAACKGSRVAVQATVTPSPAVTHTAPEVVCNNGIAAITVSSSPITNYNNYSWTPLTDLYTDPAATVPYSGGSATALYMKSSSAGEQSHYLYATNSASGCAFADTVRIWVQPGGITIAGMPDTVCNSGSTLLSLVPNTDYAPGSIQWQESADGLVYGNVGTSDPDFNTPVIATNHFYRAQIGSSLGNCETPQKEVVVSHPLLIDAPDSFHCGPGEVVLTAQTGGSSSAVWYAGPVGGAPVGSGNVFTTPYLGTTTPFYVVAGGSSYPGNVAVGAGAIVSSGQSVNPFASGWGGSKHQYLILASELAAAGIPAGATFTSLSLDVVSNGTTYPGFAVSMKNTTSTTLTTTFEGGASEFSLPADHTTTPGINTFPFNAATPFTWDGVSNLLIQTCWSNGSNNSAGSTVRCDNTNFESTHKGQMDWMLPADMCDAVTTSMDDTYTRRPKFIFAYTARCETAPREEVIAYIRPVPDVNLGADINRCVDQGASIVLDAGVQPNSTYLWDNGSTQQVRSVGENGVYTVKVTNQYTCEGNDTISVILRHNPEVELGNDTTVCNGATLTLDAGNQGIEYFWNTGAVTQEIVVNDAGTYNVFVTNNQGCVGTDTITVNMQGELPSIQGIMVTNDGQNTFQFTAVNPQNVIGYDWDFGDGSPHSYQASPTHTYDSSGNYIVVLKLSSSCGFVSDSSAAHIVGVHQLNVDKNELTVYPNPAKSTATILNRGVLKMEQVVVYNVLGQVVYRSKSESRDKHELRLDGLASGVYTIEVFTDKGTVARKLEIVR